VNDPKLTHLDEHGRAHMVDVSAKDPTWRRAVAEGWVSLQPATLALVMAGEVAKGDALAVARIAGIQGAKRASDLIPLCHPLRLDKVAVAFGASTAAPAGATAAGAAAADATSIHITVEAVAFDRTGVEMEALAGVACAALALYDMIKGVDRSASIASLRLRSKEGGRSGPWSREPERDA